VAASVTFIALGIDFTLARASLPSEPARISSDDWPWTAVGVEVIPLGDARVFEPGDVVTSIGGRSVQDLARGVFWPNAFEPLPTTLRFEVQRNGGSVAVEATLARQPVGGLLADGLPLIGYTVVQLLVAVLAWLRRPFEGWRRGFLLGASADLGSALIWELGLRASDLVRPEPILALFLLSAPMHVLFWSAVVHVLVSWPRRWEAVAGRPVLMIGLYVIPQVVLLAGVAATRGPRAVAPLDWIGGWDRIFALVVAALIVLALVAIGRAYLRTAARRDSWLRVVAGACVAVALGVGGLNALPTLLVGSPIFGRSAVAALGLPLAVVLIVGTLRARLFEVDVLLASRRRLVVAREEERRRIRRDLHDGIGPMLAAMTLRVDLARDVLRDDPAAADRALDDLKRDTQAAVAEIRRLTRELRPPALDELGLVESIRHRAVELAGGAESERVAIEVTAASTPPLDAAVEAAAYRIAVEAMTNVVRHARARHCRVRISGNGVLVVEVADDGVGFAAGRGAGVGMTSMRERCAELGGSLTVERTPDGWTVVRARLPTAA
jgi:signal transduction histidine kinase